MLKALALSSVLAIFSASLQAGCYGSSTYYTCTDQSGNTYNTLRYGNQSSTTGYNPYTGSTWSTNSQRIGSTTYQSGTAANGRTWNQTIQKIGNTTTYSGTDSKGNYFYKSCNQYGCY